MLPTFANREADFFVPDGAEPAVALHRTTHLGIGAHPDDLEFMAFEGIEACFGRDDAWFGAVTCLNGAGSPRSGLYGKYTDDEMRLARRVEQRKAATVGGYSFMAQLDYPATVIKAPRNEALIGDIYKIAAASMPRTVYTHNLADKHPAHVTVAVAAIHALRRLRVDQRPEKVYGCEIWRNLDWLPDREKAVLNVSRRENLAAALSGVFDTQITGGKRYDLATLGRRRANATFIAPFGVDDATALIFAMDLTPLVADDTADIEAHVMGCIDRFKDEVRSTLRQQLGLAPN